MRYTIHETRRALHDARASARRLACFIGYSQLLAIGEGLQGEEGEFFSSKLAQLAGLIDTMPRVYEQDGKGDAAIAHLHYFTAGCDWYITERDITEEQHQAFGLADLGYGPELGYISIAELLENGAELDLHFEPRPLDQIKERR